MADDRTEARWRRGARGAALLAVVASLACVDTTPVIVLNADDDAAVSTDGAAAVLAACLRCVNAPDSPGPGCLDEISACRENSLCAAIFVCATADGCLVVGTREQEIQCGSNCADKVGIGSSSDPAVILGAVVDGCIREHCSDVCPAYAH